MKINVLVFKLSIPSFMCLFLATALRTQEHAPTVDVCRADRAAWHDTEQETEYFVQERKHIDSGTKNRNPIANLSFKEVDLRMIEMATCLSVDEPNLDKYSEMTSFYSSVLSDRYHGFIVRHHLMKQLMNEDAAGIR